MEMWMPFVIESLHFVPTLISPISYEVDWKSVVLSQPLSFGKTLLLMASDVCRVAEISTVNSSSCSRLVARQRKGELQRLNEQLRQINAALRRQAKIESYAPSLSYAPANNRIPETEVIIDPKTEELISHLKAKKTYLRNQEPEKAYTEFKVALELAKNLNDPVKEKKAARGLG
ncbi:protein FLUORESCENT IN BLUE LIGHT, chloroplastic-like [Spinacia oleracea]|uniref:Protein FLUORESCENT IN BLUE LIGHT, chloroplastic-like n=1 Tax=Spinacia oleracea TaxID=3562 RepID=A0ABM3QX68_SPIOL|nr:protein FLUORESCENT IN BLUE LIGHT, chloroplastic-like [Spinacia oleracea]